QEAEIALAHAFDTHVVAGVGKFQQAFLIDAALFGQSPPRLGALGLVQEPLRRADAKRSQGLDLIRIESLDVGDWVARHPTLLTIPVDPHACDRLASWHQTN